MGGGRWWYPVVDGEGGDLHGRRDEEHGRVDHVGRELGVERRAVLGALRGVRQSEHLRERVIVHCELAQQRHHDARREDAPGRPLRRQLLQRLYYQHNTHDTVSLWSEPSELARVSTLERVMKRKHMATSTPTHVI